MTKKPFRTKTAVLLCVPGVLLTIGAIAAMARLSNETLSPGDLAAAETALLAIAVGLVLAVVTLIASISALVYIFRRTGSALAKTGFVVLHLLLLVVALASLAGLAVVTFLVFANPG